LDVDAHADGDRAAAASAAYGLRRLDHRRHRWPMASCGRARAVRRVKSVIGICLQKSLLRVKKIIFTRL
jgi:hypothetical protein